MQGMYSQTNINKQTTSKNDHHVQIFTSYEMKTSLVAQKVEAKAEIGTETKQTKSGISRQQGRERDGDEAMTKKDDAAT